MARPTYFANSSEALPPFGPDASYLHPKIMLRLFVVLALLVAAAVYSVSERTVASASDDGAFRVVTFNIYKGANNDDRYDLQGTIEAIARFDADLVGVQEALRNHPQFNCDDQPALIAEGLRRLTGRRWSHVYAKSWTTDNRDCIARGRGDDVAMEVLAFFAPERIVATAQIDLPVSRVGLMARVASMPDVPVVVTHLAASRRNQSQRVSQLDMLLPWAAEHGPGILMGDLNARPDATELAPITTRYRDSWLEASERGLNRGVVSGSTRPSFESRIDYLFYAPDAPLVLESVEVIDTSSPPGSVEVSDHRPVMATFRRRVAR
jgi:endonuclease/exonuclease/phosphatase family metal-dependent hydrolase